MKHLRVFYTHHTLVNVRTREPHYTKSNRHQDFPCETDPQKAYRLLVDTYGSKDGGKVEVLGDLLTGERINISPTTYVELHGSTVVDDSNRPAPLESERITEAWQLFSPMEMKACLSDKPEPTPWK